MQKSLTWILLAAALLLFGVVSLLERTVPGTRERGEPPRLFTLDWREASSVSITFPTGDSILAEKTNDGWTLRNPNYPAQQAALENFLSNLGSIRRLDRIAPHEVALQGGKSFGLEPPRARIEVRAGTNRIAFQLGARAPLTNHVYVRIPPEGAVILASAQAAELIPESGQAWRDPRLVDLGAINFDHLMIRTGPRVLELARNPTNRNWRIARPVPARANQERIAGLLEMLRNARVQQYVTDYPADLERYGLQAPDLELSLRNGTNRVFAIEFGSTPTNASRLVYARLGGSSNIVTVPAEAPEYLRQPYRNFHDPQLVNLKPGTVDRIVVESTETFELHRLSNGEWIEFRGGASFPVDPLLLGRFFTNVMTLEIQDIAKEVPTDVDLMMFGLQEPRASFSFYERLTNSTGPVTNLLITKISFGTNLAARVFSRRSDEIPVYFTSLAQLVLLPDEGFELRSRRLWNIDPNRILRVSFSNGAGTNAAVRNANGLWASDPIMHAAFSEAVLRLATLEAAEWTSKGEQRKQALGIRETPLTLTLETKEEAYIVQFGTETMQRNVYAAVNLPEENEPVLFQFPGLVFYSLIQLLPIPR